MILSTVVWTALESLRPNGLARRTTVPVLLALLYIGYTGTVEFLFSGAGGLIRHLQIWIMLFFLIVWQSRRNDLQSLVPVFWLVLAIHPIWLIVTVWTLTMVNAHAARIIVRASEEAVELTQQGVGGYALVYGMILLLPALIGLILKRHVLRGTALPRVLRRVPALAFALIALNIGLGIALIFTAGYSIAVIALVGILLSVTFLKKYNTQRFVITLLVTLVFALFARPLLEAGLNWLLPLAEGTNFAKKIRDVLASLELGNATGTAQLRAERYLRSIVLFVENPLIGVLEVGDLGKHSSILDNFARWGAVFGGIFVYLIVFPATRILRRNKRDFGAGLAMLAAVAVIFGLNNGFAAAGLMLYIMFPVSFHLLNSGTERQAAPNAAVSLA